MEEKPAIFSLFSSSRRAEPPVGEQPDASLCNSGVPAMDEGEGAPLDDCRFGRVPTVLRFFFLFSACDLR